MEFNWTTFVLEIINFLVLVWLLKRILYQPVKEVIENRRRAIDGQMAGAREIEDQAESLHRQYEQRLSEWAREEQRAREQLRREVDLERQRQLAEVNRSIEEERKKSEVLGRRQAEERRRDDEGRALQLGAAFVSRMLERVASPGLQSKLVELLLEDLRNLPARQQEDVLAVMTNDRTKTVRIESAFELAEKQKRALQDGLAALFPEPAQYECVAAPELLAGVRITAGSWVLHANLLDELAAFADISHARN